MPSTTVQLEGLSCHACGQLVSKYLTKKIPDITSVDIDIDNGETVITSGKEIEIEEVKAALAGTDYKVKE